MVISTGVIHQGMTKDDGTSSVIVIRTGVFHYGMTKNKEKVLEQEV